MRKGIVILMDTVSDKGYIEDENEQDIPFVISTLASTVNVGDIVTFDITLTPGGLIATGIIPTLSNIAKSMLINDPNVSPKIIYISKEVPE